MRKHQLSEASPKDVTPAPATIDRQVKELVADGSDRPASDGLRDFADERLKHHQQQRCHKRVLFYTTLLLELAAFVAFGYTACFSDRLIELVSLTPFALGLIAMLGAIPTVLLFVLFRCVFQPSGKEELLPSKAMDIFKSAVSIARESGR